MRSQISFLAYRHFTNHPAFSIKGVGRILSRDFSCLSAIPCRQLMSSSQWTRRSFHCTIPSNSPEYVEMPMPKLVPSMTEGILSKWLVQVGQEVQVRPREIEIERHNHSTERQLPGRRPRLRVRGQPPHQHRRSWCHHHAHRVARARLRRKAASRRGQVRARRLLYRRPRRRRRRRPRVRRPYAAVSVCQQRRWAGPHVLLAGVSQDLSLKKPAARSNRF
jgi:hypothetical protein